MLLWKQLCFLWKVSYKPSEGLQSSSDSVHKSQNNPNFIWKHKRPQSARKVQERKFWSIVCPFPLYATVSPGGRRATRKAKTPTGFTRTFPEVAEATAAGRNKVPQWHIRLKATQTQHAVPMCEWGSLVMQLPESPIFLWATDLIQSPVSDPCDLSGSLIWT